MRLCNRCGNYTDSLICSCISEEQSKKIKEFQDTFRKRNDVIILCTPYGNERKGMSSMGVGINKFVSTRKQE